MLAHQGEAHGRLSLAGKDFALPVVFGEAIRAAVQRVAPVVERELVHCPVEREPAVGDAVGIAPNNCSAVREFGTGDGYVCCGAETLQRRTLGQDVGGDPATVVKTPTLNRLRSR